MCANLVKYLDEEKVEIIHGLGDVLLLYLSDLK